MYKKGRFITISSTYSLKKDHHKGWRKYVQSISYMYLFVSPLCRCTPKRHLNSSQKKLALLQQYMDIYREVFQVSAVGHETAYPSHVTLAVTALKCSLDEAERWTTSTSTSESMMERIGSSAEGPVPCS